MPNYTISEIKEGVFKNGILSSGACVRKTENESSESQDTSAYFKIYRKNKNCLQCFPNLPKPLFNSFFNRKRKVYKHIENEEENIIVSLSDDLEKSIFQCTSCSNVSKSERDFLLNCKCDRLWLNIRL